MKNKGSTDVVFALPRTRKLRRATRSRRWEKKLRKALSLALGYQVHGISLGPKEAA